MSTNGKGSARRGWDKASRQRFEEGWDRIFGRKNKARERRTKAKHQ